MATGTVKVAVSTGANRQAFEDVAVTKGPTGLGSAIINSIIDYLADGLQTVGTMLIGTDPVKFQTTTTAVYRIAGITYAKVATDALVFTDADTVNNAGAATTDHWGAWLVEIGTDLAVHTKHATYTSGTDLDYATEAAAIAALPAVTASHVRLGYITVQSKAAKWTAKTDDLTPTSDCTTAKYYDLPAPAALPAKIS